MKKADGVLSRRLVDSRLAADGGIYLGEQGRRYLQELDAAEEIEIARVFAGQALARAKQNFRKIDDNDDELVKNLAESTYERGGYGWDLL